MTYVEQMLGRFWWYKDAAFATRASFFEQPSRKGARPPVFRKSAVTHNVLLAPALAGRQADEVLESIRRWKRHRWFGSMKSSQALTQCVFGNLIVLGKLDVLSAVHSDSGENPFQNVLRADLEYSIDYLGEVAGRNTSVDVFMQSSLRVAIECKLMETDVGRCSRPRLDPRETDYCDGTYTRQKERAARCALTTIGIRYWDYIPRLFRWDADIDLRPCPLNPTYQLVRNLLAACVLPDGRADPDGGIAILLVDDRNPAFQPGGKGRLAYDAVKAALIRPTTLQMCTWQATVAAMRRASSLHGLTDQIAHKYGF